MGDTYCWGKKINKPGHMMRRNIKFMLMAGAVTLAGCAGQNQEPPEELGALNVIDESNLNDIMLNFADPNEAVNYFRRSLNEEPDRLEFKRGLAISLIRARRYAEAVLILEPMVESGQANNDDLLALADAYLRNGGWTEARATLNRIPPTVETYDRYRLEAILADHNQEWDRADSFYETARGLTTTPANILNNWGNSKKIRGDNEAAERLFRQALSYDSDLFVAKINLAVVRAQQGNYRLPIIPMTDLEKAQLLYEIARIAANRGDRDIARGLLEQAIDISPQHFDAAVQALATLNSGPSE